MYDNKELCEKIKSIFPDVGECGVDVVVHYTSLQNFIDTPSMRSLQGPDIAA